MFKATMAIALSLMLVPELASAMRCTHGPEKIQTMNCADGLTFDAASGACVPVTSS